MWVLGCRNPKILTGTGMKYENNNKCQDFYTETLIGKFLHLFMINTMGSLVFQLSMAHGL